MTDYLDEERVTDAIDDAQALEAIKREARKIEQELYRDNDDETL